MPKYILIEIYEEHDNMTRDELYNEIVNMLGGGCNYSRPENVMYMTERAMLDVDNVECLQIGYDEHKDVVE